MSFRLTRSGRLRDALTAAQFNLNISGTGGISTEVRLLNYIRFLDMKENGNWIYNRPIWGILYCETQADIKYEYHDWVHRNVMEGLKKPVINKKYAEKSIKVFIKRHEDDKLRQY